MKSADSSGKVHITQSPYIRERQTRIDKNELNDYSRGWANIRCFVREGNAFSRPEYYFDNILRS